MPHILPERHNHTLPGPSGPALALATSDVVRPVPPLDLCKVLAPLAVSITTLTLEALTINLANRNLPPTGQSRAPTGPAALCQHPTSWPLGCGQGPNPSPSANAKTSPNPNCNPRNPNPS